MGFGLSAKRGERRRVRGCDRSAHAFHHTHTHTGTHTRAHTHTHTHAHTHKDAHAVYCAALCLYAGWHTRFTASGADRISLVGGWGVSPWQQLLQIAGCNAYDDIIQTSSNDTDQRYPLKCVRLHPSVTTSCALSTKHQEEKAWRGNLSCEDNQYSELTWYMIHLIRCDMNHM